MQRVLGYTPMQVGLAFLPGNVIMAVCSLGISAWVVNRYGIRRPLAGGLAAAAVAWRVARAPVDGGFVVDVLPGMILLGLGAGIAFNPLLLAAMSGVDEREAGLASGIVNTSFMMGGALGLAVLASLAAAQVGPAGASGGAGEIAAVNRGYQLAFAAGAVFALIAAVLGAWLVPRRPAAAAGVAGPAPAGASAAE